MPLIITITHEPINFENSTQVYDYSLYDRILKNIFREEYEVYYSGQNKGLMDHYLLTGIENREIFKVYYRNKKGIPYIYLGETKEVSVVQNRRIPINETSNSEERLKISLIIKTISNTLVPENNFTGTGKYKKDVLVHAGLRDLDNNSIIPHNRNTNLGYYYYE